MKFKNTDRYFIGLLVLTFIGFWPSYFSKFFDGSADFTHYFHFHSATALMWVGFVILQPILIRNKKFALHKLIGKISYVLVPLLFISVLLLAHHRITLDMANPGLELWIPIKDLVIFSFGYLVAIKYKNKMPIHARGMIVASMALIEPVMVRVMFNVLDIQGAAGYLPAISVDYIVLFVLIYLERKEKIGRWVFPTALGLFLFIHLIVITSPSVPFWENFTRWFLSLPLT